VSGDAVRVGAAVEVRVPASSANLGPGFDSVGCALGVWDTCRATVAETPGLVVSVVGEGADAVPLDATHLVHRAMQVAWSELGVEPPAGLLLECRNEVPHGRGMGSSATAIVTGIVAAQALHDVARGLDGADVDLGFAGTLASRLEGHPDNATASVHGGVTLSWSDDELGTTRTVHLGVHPDVEPVVFVPDAQLSTAKARSVLPLQVRLADAAANSARTALLAHAITSAPEHLLAATRDWLHQEARRPSYAASMALVDGLRAEGHAAVISGAGPSVLVLGPRLRTDAVAAHGAGGWRVLRPGIPPRGAQVTVLDRG
jgi:homoserine kinase